MNTRKKTVTEAVIELIEENKKKDRELKILKEENKQLERRLKTVERHLGKFSRLIRESFKKQSYLRERHDALANQVDNLKGKRHV